MRKSFFAMLAVTAGLAMTGLTTAPANALPVSKSAVSTQSDVIQVGRGEGRGFGMHRGGGRGFYHGGGFRNRGWHRGGGWRHRGWRGSRIIIGPSYGYRYGHGYGRGCHWLKRKAIVTGSRYWWRRYNQCRYY